MDRVRLRTINRGIPDRIPLVRVPFKGRGNSRVIGKLIHVIMRIKRDWRPLPVNVTKANATGNIINNCMSFHKVNGQSNSPPTSLMVSNPIANSIKR